ncbi:amidohydrolase [Luteimicrobium xylanilyticum]|uniref:amidohydrolase n=1 Tax=Luteimicrobium xylanilyticum TaxID=1133546 RepID=UPI0004AE8147|nr:amidohydrolase [Luteimicrobium xylanilyticum]
MDLALDACGTTVVDLREAAESGPATGSEEAWTFDGWVGAGRRLEPGGSVDLGGRLVLPPFVNGHVHLDKTFVGSRWQPYRGGPTVSERVAVERELRNEVDVPVAHRALALAEALIGQGTGVARTHVDVDPDVRLDHLEAVLALRESLGGRLDLQVVAFPQSGVLTSPGVAELLDEAVLQGADVVGGLDPHEFDGDAERHLDAVFAIAERRSVPVDLHLHELGRHGERALELLADRTEAHGMQGLVTVSHAYGLGTLSAESLRRVGERLARADVRVMTNGPAGPMPPVLLLRSLGVTVFSGTDNVRDAWWPYGDGDMLTVARTVAYQSGFRRDEELEVALDLVTDAAAHALALDGYGIAPGRPADLVILEASCAAEAVAAPARRTVVRSGTPLTAATTPLTPAPRAGSIRPQNHLTSSRS